jgi:hypothetical protein
MRARNLSLAMAVVLLFSVPSWSQTSQPASPSYPQKVIENGCLRATIFLPDSEKGYYRGARFDWSGMVGKVTWNNHTCFADWKTPHDPMDPEGAIGLAEEFRRLDSDATCPPGFREAKPGEAFVKIGVGLLEKTKNPEYNFMTPYRIIKPGNWKVSSGKNWIEFTQVLSTTKGWGYTYTKRVSLASEKPVLTISHVLKNIGTRTIETDHYCHNFFNLDNTPIGPAYTVTFPFPLKSPVDKPGKIRGNQIVFDDIIPLNHGVCGEFTDFPKTADNNRARIENHETGAVVEITGSSPPKEMVFYAVQTAICPEPFVAITLLPGQETTWQTEYRFMDTKFIAQ